MAATLGRWFPARAMSGGLDGDVGRGEPHGDADVGHSQGEGVVGAVADHGHEVAFALQGFDDPQLVLGEELRPPLRDGEAPGHLGGRFVVVRR